MTFEQWFDKEHGILDVYDFEHRAAAYTWYNQLKVAFEAGRSSTVKSISHIGYQPNHLNLDDGYQ